MLNVRNSKSSALVHERLDLGDPDAVADYERALYAAFRDSDIGTLDRIWQFDHDAKRLRPRVPYAGQQVFVSRVDGEIVAGIPMHLDMSGPLQLETMGFEIDKGEPGVCEGLGVFSLCFLYEGRVIALELRDHVFEALRAQAIRKAYGTCSQKRLRPYQLLGFRVIDERDFDGERKYLLLRDVE
ncbi:MAG: hypothetical protein KC619_05420 [Myxococcales bacterium]|nr:hypothetical protein [Myxococcales bacterium]